MSKSWARRLAPLAIIALAVAVAFAMVKNRSELPRREGAIRNPLVEVQIVEPGPVATRIRSRGTVAPKRRIELASEVSGKVVWVAEEFVQGGRVAKGDVLLRIDPIDYEVALSDARAALAGAQLSLAEVQVVVKRAAIEEAEARVQAAKDRLRQAEVDLANTEILAPFNAIIDAKAVDMGQYVQTGVPLMTLLGTDTAEVRLPILASDAPFVRYGQGALGTWPKAELSARFGGAVRTWWGRLVRLEQRVDAQTRVFYLVAEIDRPYDTGIHLDPLSVGLFVEAEIAGKEIAGAVVLPRTALHDNASVFVLQDGKLRRRPVTLLRMEGERVIVGDGLEAGEQVVLSRLDIMVDGMPVDVEP
jgi:RND family efflux transporter MFP subunit